MSKKELKKLVEAGFIPGIYNFCDRWCEKCTQQHNCLSYVMGKKMENKLGIKPDEGAGQENENVWVYLKNIFDSTYEILHDLAEERGIGMEDIYASENVDKGFWADEYDNVLEDDEQNDFLVSSSDIIKICLIYENLSDDCLESVFGILDEKSWKTDSPEEKETADALDAVNWYLDIIHSKIRRALYAYHQGPENTGRKQGKIDCDGSAKVALLGIDRSVKAWEVLEKYCTSLRKEIAHIKVVLKQLALDIEKQFPEARAFQRPGFDE